MIRRLGLACYRRRRLVLALWVALVVGLSAFAATAAGDWRNDYSLPGSETQAASALLLDGGFEGRGGSLSGQLVIAAPDVTTGPVSEGIEALLARIRAEVDMVLLVGPFDEEASGQISADRRVAIAWIEFGEVYLTDAQVGAAAIRAIGDGFEGFPAGVRVEYGGDAFWEEAEFSSEGVGFAAAVVILLLTFGSVLAMGLPIATALAGIGGAAALVALLANWLTIPDFAPAVVAMIGIGVGIDYSLMIVTRYREELAAGRQPIDAVDTAAATAGRAVFVAGSTVLVSMLGLTVVGVSATRTVAVAVIAGVLLVMAAALTLLPALLGFVGHRIDRLRVRRVRVGMADDASFWYRWSRTVQRRPGPIALGGVAVLLVLAAPMTSMRLGFSDAGNRLESDTARRAHDLVAAGFGPGFTNPLVLAVDTRPVVGVGDHRAANGILHDLGVAVAADEGVAMVSAPSYNAASGVALVHLVPTTSSQDPATAQLVHRLRDRVIPSVTSDTEVSVLVGGSAAAVVDFSDDQSGRLIVFIAAVLAVSFVLLTFVYRSVLVPAKAVLMNLLSIGAAYGVVVAVFQWGWGAGLLGVGEPGPIEAWIPMMMFAVVFGLSMDYEVFLLSRIREQHRLTGDNSTAVADGLARTARLISAAAAIMCCVFGAFVLSDERALQMIGLGLAVAVLLDATLVRLVLVPATMELLGERNWWMPRWMEARLPRLEIEPDVDIEPSPPRADHAPIA